MDDATPRSRLRSLTAPGEHDGLADLFEPDFVLPEQLLEGYRNDSYLSGEKALMLAVLEDGLRCFQEHFRNARYNPRLLSQEAEEWIRAEDWDWPFSFNNVCDALGLDPEAMRASLLRWKDTRLKAMGGDDQGPPRKMYRLHLRTKRSHGVRSSGS